MAMLAVMSERPDRTIATQPVDRTLAPDSAALDSIQVSAVAPTQISHATASTRAPLSSATHATIVSSEASTSTSTRPRSSTIQEAGAATSSAALTGGSLIGKYIVVRKLGEGGMGQVFAAYDTELDRKVAIKLLRASYQSETAIARLQREAQGLARLSHPNVVQVYELGRHDGAVYIAMEYVEGVTLREHLSGQTDRTWRTTLATLIQAGQGLAAAHAVKLVHRDFKPDNVIVGKDGQVRVLDFGLVRHAESGREIDDEPGEGNGGDDAITASPVARELTRTGAIMGTPAYMALEQLEGRTADAFTDQFAFCVVVYEALYGYRPFDGDTAAAVAARMYAGEVRPRPPKSEVPRVVHDAILRGLAATPGERWPDMAKLLDTLAASLEHRKRGWVWVGLGATGSLVGLVVIATPLIREALAERDQTIAAQGQDLSERERLLELAAAELEQRNAELQQQFDIQAGLTATLLAESPGRSIDALKLAIDVYGRYRLADQTAPLAIEAGLFAATRRLHDAHDLPRQTEPIDALVFSSDGSRLATAGRDDTARLWAVASGEQLRSFTGHVDDLRGVEFSGDGARLLTTSTDATATIWLVETGKVLATIDDYDVSVASFAPDGHSIAVGAEDGTLSLWAAEPGEPIVEQRAWPTAGPLVALRFSADGTRLASATSSGVVQLWDGDQQRARIDNSRATTRTLAFSRDGTRLALPGTTGQLLLRDGQTGAAIATLDIGRADLHALAFSPAGPPRLLTTDQSGPPKLFHADTGTLIAELQDHRDLTTDLAFSPDGQRFATVGYDARLRIGESTSGRVLETLEGQLDPLTRVLFSPDGRHIVSLDTNAVVRVWSAARIHDAQLIAGRGRDVAAIAFAPDRSHVLVGERDGHASVWTLTGEATGTLVHDLDHAGKSVYAVAFSPTGDKLATGDTGKLARIWDARSGALLHTLDGHPSDVKAIGFSPDGRTLASADLDGKLRLWTVDSGELVREWKAAEQGVTALAFAPSGESLATCGLIGFCSVWNVQTGEREQLLPSEGLLFALAFSPDSTQLAVAGASKRIDIWQLGPEPRATTLIGEDPNIEALAFSPDGTRLLTGGDAWVRMWDVAAALHLADFAGHDAALRGVAFSTDGNTVLSGSADGSVRASVADADERLRRTCLALRSTREFAAVANTCAALLDR